MVLTDTLSVAFDFSSPGWFRTDHLRFSALWLAFGCAMVAAVVLLSIIDLPAQVQTVMLHDKVAHLIAYAGLMGWFVQIFRHDLTRLVLLLGFVTLGIGVEFVQGMVPSRQFEVLDMIANTSGALLAWALAYTRVGQILPAVERLWLRLFTAPAG